MQLLCRAGLAAASSATSKLDLPQPHRVTDWKSLPQYLRSYCDRTWVRVALLITLGIGARWPALQGQLLWDDNHLVAENPFIRSPFLILEAFRHYLFPDSFGGHYRPVQTISYAFDYVVWNGDTYGFHLSNVLWHVAGGCLLYGLLRQLVRGIGETLPNWNSSGTRVECATILDAAAFVATLLWVVHPVHSAAIDYISGRADSLACVFGAGGWLLYLRGREIGRPIARRVTLSLAALSALLALCSRESGFLWLFLFLFHLFVFDRKAIFRTKLLALACCIALTGVYAGLRQLPARSLVGDAVPSQTHSNRAILMLRALGDYGQLIVWPANLHMERTIIESGEPHENGGWGNAIPFDHLAFAGVIFGGLLLYGAFRPGPTRTIRVFGMSWFLLAYLPTSNLIALNATVAEHWLYLPSVGLFLFVVGCGLELPRRTWKLATVAACLAVVGLSVRSFIRSSDWVTPETFYRRTLQAGGSSVRMAVNLAEIYSQRGENARAESILRKVLHVDPNYWVARNNLGAALSAQGKTAEAEKMYNSASAPSAEERETFPHTWAAALNLARAAHNRNDDNGALTIIDKARRDYPGTWPVLRFEAELLRRTQGPTAAFPLVKKFVEDNWWHCEASIALGRLFSEMGDVAGAEKAWRRASWLDVHDAEALNLMALLSVRRNKLEEACKTQRRAVARQPDQPRQYLLLSDILEKMGRAEESLKTLAEVNRLESMARARLAVN
jgi:protein O-mannosyl-transferase